MNNSITYIAMDTHKKQHSVALLYPNDEKVIQFSVKNTPAEIRKMVRKIKRNAPGQVQFCYEAGVCGFTLQRRIVAEGCPCIVIAPYNDMVKITCIPLIFAPLSIRYLIT